MRTCAACCTARTPDVVHRSPSRWRLPGQEAKRRGGPCRTSHTHRAQRDPSSVTGRRATHQRRKKNGSPVVRHGSRLTPHHSTRMRLLHNAATRRDGRPRSPAAAAIPAAYNRIRVSQRGIDATSAPHRRAGEGLESPGALSLSLRFPCSHLILLRRATIRACPVSGGIPPAHARRAASAGAGMMTSTSINPDGGAATNTGMAFCEQ